MQDKGLEVGSELSIPAVPHACVGTGLGTGLSLLSHAKIRATGGLTPGAQVYLGYAEAGRTRGEADALFAPSVPLCPQWEDSVSSAEALAGCLYPSAFGSPQVRSVSWEAMSVELSSGLLML